MYIVIRTLSDPNGQRSLSGVPVRRGGEMSVRRGGEARWLSVVKTVIERSRNAIINYQLSIISAAGGYQFTQL